MIDDEGNQTVEPSGTVLVFGKGPMIVTDDPGPSGLYHFVLQATDASGAVAVDTADVQVDNSEVDATLQGFKDINFGSSFEDAIGSLGHDLFNPYSVKECFDQLPLKGCGLSAATDDDNNTKRPYEMRDGIGYGLGLSFNKRDKLTDISLTYRRETGISGVQCRDIIARTVDWVAKDYGPMRYLPYEDGRSADIIHTKTEGGTSYFYNNPGKSGSFVTSFIRLKTEQTREKADGGKRLVETLNRNVTVLGSYIVVGNGSCNVDVWFREPDAVERAASLAP